MTKPIINVGFKAREVMRDVKIEEVLKEPRTPELPPTQPNAMHADYERIWEFIQKRNALNEELSELDAFIIHRIEQHRNAFPQMSMWDRLKQPMYDGLRETTSICTSHASILGSML
jgi:hypothetical protein